MQNHNLKMAFRNMARSKSFFFINVLGLSLGLAIVFLILNYVSFEFNYDKQHGKQDRIYRVESLFYEDNVLTDDWATSSFGYGSAMAAELKGIEAFTRVGVQNTEQTVIYEDKRVRENDIAYADSSFLKIFDFEMKAGAREGQLVRPKTVLITESAAMRFFPNEDPIGKVLTFASGANFVDCEVTGVLRDFPGNSHIRFSYLISHETLPNWMKDFWYLHEAYTYLLLYPETNPADLESQFPEMAEKYKTGEALANKKWSVHLEPLTKIHLQPQKQYEKEIKGNKRSLITLLIIAVIILLMGWFNYINLTTTQSMEKAKEVGVRKATGASRFELIWLYMAESLILNLMAIGLACVLVLLLHPYFAKITGVQVGFYVLEYPLFWCSALAMLVVGTLLSGLYPAFVMSSIRPATIMKGNYVHSKTAGTVRRILVVFQFAASIFLVCGTMVIYKQVKFMQEQDLGVDIGQTLVVKYPVSRGNVFKQVELFSEKLKAEQRFKSVSLSGSVPGFEVAKFASNSKLGSDESENRLYEMLTVDDQFIDAFDLQLLAGKPFKKGEANLMSSLIVNEAALGLLNISSPDEAIGQQVMIEGQTEPVTITGVLANWHQRGLGNNYTPIMLVYNGKIGWVRPGYIAVKLAGGNMQDDLNSIKAEWGSYFPDASFDYFFLDELFDNQYKTDRRYGQLVTLFTVLAFVISVLGLWALASYTASKKIREVGIRKVLGAEGSHIVYLFSKEIILLIVVSILIATPASMFVMKRWLESYAFHTSVSIWVYIAGGLMTLVVAIVTILRESYRVSTLNPVETIKYE